MPGDMSSPSEIQNLKEEGNKFFRNGQFEEALSFYCKALNVNDVKDEDKAVIYRNKAACHLKLKAYKLAIDDATAALDLTADEPKSLFRRCVAHEQLGQLENAFKDAIQLLKVEPTNKAVQPILNRLNPIIQDRAKQQASTNSRVSQMFQLAFSKDNTVSKETKLQALNNLIVLARDSAGAEKIIQENGVARLKEIAASKDAELMQSGLRLLSTMSSTRKRAEVIVGEIGVNGICQCIGQENVLVCSAASHLAKSLIIHITNIELYQEKVKQHEENRKKGERNRYPQFEMDDSAKDFVEQLFQLFVKMLISGKTSACGRDYILEIFIKYISRLEGVGWTKQFMEKEGIQALLAIAGTVQEQESLIPVTEHSRMHASLLLSRIYDDLRSDKEQNLFKEECHNYFRDQFGEQVVDSTLEAVAAISTLLQGPFEVGQMMLGIEGVMQVMLALANSDNKMHQRVSVEAIVHSASKKAKCSGILNDTVPVLKKLFNSSDSYIQVRALVGLCKFGSFFGTDAAGKPLPEGSTLTFAKLCQKFLTNPTNDVDLRKWATEGLAYLSLDADIKEELVKNKPALQSLIDLAKNADKMIIYSAVTVFVNLTNSYDKQDIPEELAELAKFSKYHIPEEHPKDKMEYIIPRIHKLADAGMVTALVELAKTDSKNSKEQITRVFLALATEENLRGVIVQQGGAKTLISLALENTDLGKILAAHALAKVAVTMNPTTAFPGQRIYEVVRPLIHLLPTERSGLQNFEALLALTNLSSVSESVRNRICTENGVSQIESYMFEDHDMICRAATECMCNMVMTEKVAKMFEGQNDRVKLLLLYCSSEDPALVTAAAGTLATLSVSQVICQKIVEVNQWYEILQSLAVSEVANVQHRGCYILNNMVQASKDLAMKIVEGQMLEILMAISKLETPEKAAAKECAEMALQTAADYSLIKPSESTSSLSVEED